VHSHAAASSDHLVPGELVVAIGSPLTLTNSCTSGVVSNVNREDVELGIQSHMSYIQVFLLLLACVYTSLALVTHLLLFSRQMLPSQLVIVVDRW